MVLETVSMVWEPVYGVGACVYGNPMILVSAPVPLGQIGYYNLLGLGWGFGTKGLGTGLDNTL